MPWQTTVAIQLLAGNTIINASGDFVYSSAPAAGNLIASVAPAAGTDSFGNHFLAGAATYAATFATSLQSGGISFFSGSLAAGWTGPLTTIAGDASGTLQINAGGALQLIASTAVSIQGGTSVGPADNSGVTSGPSGTVSSFPAAGPNHTHAMAHHHPYHP